MRCDIKRFNPSLKHCFTKKERNDTGCLKGLRLHTDTFAIPFLEVLNCSGTWTWDPETGNLGHFPVFTLYLYFWRKSLASLHKGLGRDLTFYIRFGLCFKLLTTKFSV